MTTAAICPTWGVLRGASYYRAEQYDSDLGLYYLRARYYNPVTGRFLSRDPEDGKAKDPASLHKYLYAGGDPVNLADPRGRDSILETGAIDTSFLLETLPAFLASELAVRGACTVAVIVLLDGLSPDIQWRVGGILLAACGII